MRAEDLRRMEVDDLVDLTPPTTENLLRVLHRRFKRDLIHVRARAEAFLANWASCLSRILLCST
jgi:hypothetical protein